MHDFLSEEREAGWWGEAAEVGRLAWQALNVLATRGIQPWVAQGPLLARFIDAAAAGDRDRFGETVAEMRRSRISPRAIIDSYVPEAARRLGEDWVADRRGFAEVTIGCSALQSLVRTLSIDCDPATPAETLAEVLLAVPAGEDHTLGAVVAASWLRRNGASVALVLQPGADRLCEIAAAGGYDLVMLSWGNAESLDKLAAIVKQIRAALPRGTPVIVGGSVIGRVDGIETATGADLATNDLELALSRVSLIRSGTPRLPSRRRG